MDLAERTTIVTNKLYKITVHRRGQIAHIFYVVAPETTVAEKAVTRRLQENHLMFPGLYFSSETVAEEFLHGQPVPLILATNDYLSTYPEIAASAVNVADAVLAELRKPKEEGGAE